MAADPEKPKEGLSINELSLYTAPQQKFRYVEPEKGTMEENVTVLRKQAEPYLTWCQQTTITAKQTVQGAYGMVKPKVDSTIQFGQDSYVYLKNPPPEFYPRAGIIGFAGILGLFLARGSRFKRLIYPTGLMVVGASMYYPQQAATIAKNTGDTLYEFALQAYVAAENLIKEKPKTVKPPKEKKVEKSE